MTEAYALFRGAGLVIEAVSDDFQALAGMEVVGLPASELWASPTANGAQRLMRATLTDGVARSLPLALPDGRRGSLVIVRVEVAGHPWGVATEWQPAGVPASPNPLHHRLVPARP